MTLQTRRAELLAELAEIDAQIERESLIGRFVVTNDSWCNQWSGPFLLQDRMRLARGVKVEPFRGVHPINLTPWEGGECPVDPEQEVIVLLENGNEEVGFACGFAWVAGKITNVVVAYAAVDLKVMP